MATIPLIIEPGQSLKSLKQMQQEIKSLELQMAQAANVGNKQLFDSLGKSMGELKNDLVDLKAKFKYADPGELLGGFTKLAQGGVKI